MYINPKVKKLRKKLEITKEFDQLIIDLAIIQNVLKQISKVFIKKY